MQEVLWINSGILSVFSDPFKRNPVVRLHINTLMVAVVILCRHLRQKGERNFCLTLCFTCSSYCVCTMAHQAPMISMLITPLHRAVALHSLLLG